MSSDWLSGGIHPFLPSPLDIILTVTGKGDGLLEAVNHYGNLHAAAVCAEIALRHDGAQHKAGIGCQIIGGKFPPQPAQEIDKDINHNNVIHNKSITWI